MYACVHTVFSWVSHWLTVFRLIPYLSYCDFSYNKWCAHTSSITDFCLSKFPGAGRLLHDASSLRSLRNVCVVLHNAGSSFPLPTAGQGTFPTPSPALIVVWCFLAVNNPSRGEVKPCSFVCLSLMAAGPEHVFMCLLATCVSSLEHACSYLWFIFITGLFRCCWVSWALFGTWIFSIVVYFANIFSHSVYCLFTLLVSFAV